MEALAASLVLGFHLVSQHAAPGLNDFNPGVYLMREGLTAGVYYNSYRRAAAYAGWTWQTVDGRLALTAAAATGYPQAPVVPVLIPSFTAPLSPTWSARLSVVPKPAWPPEPAVFHLSLERRW